MEYNVVLLDFATMGKNPTITVAWSEYLSHAQYVAVLAAALLQAVPELQAKIVSGCSSASFRVRLMWLFISEHK